MHTLTSIGPRHRLRAPLTVVAGRTPNGFVVSDQVIHRSGDGATLPEAMDEYTAVLLEYFAEFRLNRGHLSPRLSKHLNALEEIVEEVRHATCRIIAHEN